nr:ATP-binding cassette domain-containing protein [Nitrososphaeria archaeon]
MKPILSIRGLNVRYKSSRGDVKAVRNATLDVRRGETLFLVGESGAGKSTLSLAILRILPEEVGEITSGKIVYYGEGGDNLDITTLKGKRLRRFRWKEASMVFQGAMNSLNPIMRIKGQLNDVMKAHKMRISKKKARERMMSLLDMVKLDADRVLKSYPHQLSGGMRQRVMIAMSLLLDPKIVILDEPTTALDVLTQKNIMDVLKEI